MFVKNRYGPCRRDCPDRCADPNCHETCEKFLEFKKQEAELNQKVHDGMYSQARGYAIENRTKVLHHNHMEKKRHG